MTGSTESISPEQQQAWWSARVPDRWQIYLYEVDGVAVAYGLLRLVDDRWWLTFGVAAHLRGRGIGKQVARHLVGLVPGPIWADMHVDNAASVGALHSVGFVGGLIEDGVIRGMMHPGST